jgi:hypothetical protein
VVANRDMDALVWRTAEASVEVFEALLALVEE